MNISALARSLNISRQMVYKSQRRGMPTDSLEAAVAWRKKNIHPFQSKTGRIGGNSGVKQKAMKREETRTDTLITNSITHTLTDIIPNLWFGQIGWLGGALRDYGVTVTAEQLIKIQAFLFLVYMEEVDEFLKTKNKFMAPETLMTKQGSVSHNSLCERLNGILRNKLTVLYEKATTKSSAGYIKIS